MGAASFNAPLERKMMSLLSGPYTMPPPSTSKPHSPSMTRTPRFNHKSTSTRQSFREARSIWPKRKFRASTSLSTRITWLNSSTTANIASIIASLNAQFPPLPDHATSTNKYLARKPVYHRDFSHKHKMAMRLISLRTEAGGTTKVAWRTLDTRKLKNELESNTVAMQYCCEVDTVSRMFPSLPRPSDLLAAHHVSQYRRVLSNSTVRQSGEAKCGCCQSHAGENRLEGVVKLSCWMIPGQQRACTRCCQENIRANCSFAIVPKKSHQYVTSRKNREEMMELTSKVIGIVSNGGLGHRQTGVATKALERIKELIGNLSNKNEPGDDANQNTDPEDPDDIEESEEDE